MSVLAELSNSNSVLCMAYKSEVKGLENPVTSSVEGLDVASTSDRMCEEAQEEDNEEEPAEEASVNLGPLVPLAEELEHDKDDESLRRWKEQLLGSLYLDPPGEAVEPKVILSEIKIVCKGRADIVIPIPFIPDPSGHMFSLKEGSSYSLNFTFLVRRNIVPGLTYINTVWKNGLKVDHSKVMIGTFSPQLDPYIHKIEEETTPTGILARGVYTAKTKLVDDEKRCHFELEYSFVIRRDWSDVKRKMDLPHDNDNR